MKVAINRESPIPLHDQLVQQISLQIAAGVLRPGERLPSIRDLARRLDVHPNTVSAVYKSLEGYGVVVVRQGSGVRVLETEPGAEDDVGSLARIAERFVAAARLAGHGDDAVKAAIDRALSPATIDRLVVVDPHPDFHPLYLHELRRAFRCPIETVTVEELAARQPASLERAAIATSMYHLAATQTAAGARHRVRVFQVGTADELLGVIRTVPSGQTVALVSVSPTLLALAKDLIGGMRGGDLDILEADPSDEERLRSVTRLADVFATDGPSAAAVAKLAPGKTRLTMELLPPAAIELLADQLPPRLRTNG